mmetsp:Transcript_42853/g.92493  ORF Transcript_42853/g.92493 Transcript_42853/m.92493 type:complete len:243 (+) Transcript_42853:2-730(+)
MAKLWILALKGSMWSPVQDMGGLGGDVLLFISDFLTFYLHMRMDHFLALCSWLAIGHICSATLGSSIGWILIRFTASLVWGGGGGGGDHHHHHYSGLAALGRAAAAAAAGDEGTFGGVGSFAATTSNMTTSLLNAASNLSDYLSLEATSEPRFTNLCPALVEAFPEQVSTRFIMFERFCLWLSVALNLVAMWGLFRGALEWVAQPKGVLPRRRTRSKERSREQLRQRHNENVPVNSTGNGIE